MVLRRCRFDTNVDEIVGQQKTGGRSTRLSLLLGQFVRKESQVAIGPVDNRDGLLRRHKRERWAVEVVRIFVPNDDVLESDAVESMK